MSERLILPWEEKRRRMPPAARVVLFLIVLGGVLAMFANQCSVPEAHAQDPGSTTYWPQRQALALESIAETLRKIERKMR